MGVHVIKMPDIGEGIAEVELVAWHVRPGAEVAEDQVLADVMTDKATVEIPSPVAGRVLALGGEVGQTLAVGAELIRIEVQGAGNLAAAPPAAAAALVSTPSPPCPRRRPRRRPSWTSLPPRRRPTASGRSPRPPCAAGPGSWA